MFEVGAGIYCAYNIAWMCVHQ